MPFQSHNSNRCQLNRTRIKKDRKAYRDFSLNLCSFHKDLEIFFLINLEGGGNHCIRYAHSFTHYSLTVIPLIYELSSINFNSFYSLYLETLNFYYKILYFYNCCIDSQHYHILLTFSLLLLDLEFFFLGIFLLPLHENKFQNIATTVSKYYF